MQNINQQEQEYEQYRSSVLQKVKENRMRIDQMHDQEIVLYLANIHPEATDLEVREAFGHKNMARHMYFEGFVKDSKRHSGLGWIQFMDREIAKNSLEASEIRVRDRNVRLYIDKDDAMKDERN